MVVSCAGGKVQEHQQHEKRQTLPSAGSATCAAYAAYATKTDGWACTGIWLLTLCMGVDGFDPTATFVGRVAPDTGTRVWYLW